MLEMLFCVRECRYRVENTVGEIWIVVLGGCSEGIVLSNYSGWWFWDTGIISMAIFSFHG